MLKNLRIENFSNEYCNQLVEMWNRNLPLDKTSQREFIKMHLCDLNFDEHLVLLAFSEEIFVGFVFGIKRKYPHNSKGLQPDTAWIKLLVVDQNFQRNGIGSLLIEELERRFIKSGVKKIILANYSPSYVYSGVDSNSVCAVRFFEKHGFKMKETSFWMERSLDEYKIPNEVLIKKKLLESEGFVFENYHDELAYSLIKMIHANFSTSWLESVMNAIKNETASENIIVCTKGTQVVGYVSRASIDNNPSRFGPFGVSSDYRNYKIGEILINEMFESMFEKGVLRVFFKSTEENGKRFYLRQNMEVKRTFWKYEKQLDS